MPIYLSEEQELRVKAVLGQGSYESIDEVMDAALAAIELGSAQGLAGSKQDIDARLVEGLISAELTEEEFWNSVNTKTDKLLAEHKASQTM